MSTEEYSSTDIDLGFLEPSEPWKLESRFFPSKVGGKPSWLDLSTSIPSFSDLKCLKCNEILRFMCQVYAPIDTNQDCFHRTIFIFICRNEKCSLPNSNINMKVFRNQLSRNNNYYPCEPPVEEEAWRVDLTTTLFGVNLCQICGVKSSSHCAKCKSVYYCCKQHQLIDWKSGHKTKCKPGAKTTEFKVKTTNRSLFPEYELITEAEDLSSDSFQTTAENQDIEMQKYKKLIEEGKAGTLQGKIKVVG